MTTLTDSDSLAIKLAIPRHLQDYNGYCGPACAMMVLSAEAKASLPAQQTLFRGIREHAKNAQDKRPIKSPAESLLALLSAHGKARWRKVFDPSSDVVAGLLLQAVAGLGHPCLLLINKGMHWVVAFGRTLREDGSVAGVLMRDPAWAGMPPFFGLSIYPEKSTFTHTADSCACLQSDNPPGSVHERYMALEELVSPRGLQGSPDWEGKGALALIPAELEAAAVLLTLPPAAPAAAGLTPQAAALLAVKEHGLLDRPDWQQTLMGGMPGQPILVKDPEDPRDDFYLVPIHAKNGVSSRTAWIMLDPVTLKLREASLLDHWMVPALPTDADADKISSQTVQLADGTQAQFKKSVLRPNQRNLVWKASAASILPYWPLREFTAPHPVTGEPTSIFVTQHGEIHTVLGQEEMPEISTAPANAAGHGIATAARMTLAAAAGAGLTYFLAPKPAPAGPKEEIAYLAYHLEEMQHTHQKDLESIKSLKYQIARLNASIGERKHTLDSFMNEGPPKLSPTPTPTPRPTPRPIAIAAPRPTPTATPPPAPAASPVPESAPVAPAPAPAPAPVKEVKTER